MSIGCSLTADSTFGPWAGSSCRGGFDFTLFFEQSILTIGPTSVFLLISPLRLYFLARQKPVTFINPIRVFKLIAACTYAALELVLLCLWAANPPGSNAASTASVALRFVAALFVIALSWLEDDRSLRPSTLLNVYILLTSLLDLAQIRTLWLSGSSVPIAAVFSTGTGIKIGLVVLESRTKRGYLISKNRRHPPETLSGIISRSFMWWLKDIFQYGYKGLIKPDDLYALDKDLAADVLHHKITSAWTRRRTPERRFEYLLAASKILWWPFMQSAIPRLFLIGFTFAQTFLISRAVTLLSSNRPEYIANQIGSGLVGAAVLIYIGIAVSRLLSSHRLYRTITMFRGATVSLIYNHALEMQDGLYDEGASITLMSADTDRVALAIDKLNEVWSRLIEVVVAIILLAQQLRWVAVMPLILVILGFIGGGIICKDIGTNIKVWTDAVQKRITLTSSVLSDMKAVKTMGLSTVLTSLVRAARIEEMKLMGAFRSNLAWALIFAMSPGIWAPPVAFAVFAVQASIHGVGSINTAQAFTSLSIIALFCEPANILVQSLVDVFAAMGSSDRIQKFLVTPQHKDQRHLPSSGSETSRRLSSVATAIELEEHPLPSKSRGSSTSIAISVEDADLRPVTSAPLTLHNISLAIPRGSITMVVGLVGSGKTTLLRALLGEIPCERGQVYLYSKHVSYCSQTTWLPNTSIRRAICGADSPDSRVHDEKWYRTVLDACALGPDLDLMPEGDETMLGSANAALSGGQKQRIALARAVYARAHITILDDVLSALDSGTKKTVVEHLLGEGSLFKTLGTTVVLVTHDSKYLDYAHQILALSEGQIKSAATYGELLQDGVSEFFTTASANELEDARATDFDTTRAGQKAKRKSTHEDSKSLSAESSRAMGEWNTYKYYFRSVGWKHGSLFFFMTLLSSFFLTFGSMWLKIWTDDDDGQGQTAFYISIYLVIALLATVTLGLQVWSILCLIGPSTGIKLHQILLDTVMRAPQSFFSSTDSGSILNRFSQDMTLIEGTLPAGMLQTVSNIFVVAFSVAFVATGSTYMAASIPALLVALWLLQRVYLRTSRQMRLLDLEAKGPLYSHFLESINGLTTIRSFGWQQECKAELLRRLDLSQRPYYLMYCIQRWLALVLDLIVAGEAVLVVGLALGLRSSTSAGLLGVSLNSILAFNKRVRNLIEGWTELETSLGSITRVRDFERGVLPEAKEGEDREPPLDWPQRGEIEFRKVSASHNSSNIVLHDVSFRIGASQKVGICGRTGSGKSSLVGSLIRLLEVNTGSIFVDDIDLATVSRDTIRERLVTIPQETLILTGSLRLNVDPGHKYSDISIIRALDRVGLWTMLDERGGLDAELTASVLSKGQQQLLALARAILKRGKILLLDEPTSNVDAETDAVMQRIMQQEFESCTILTVAHRLDSIMNSDIIAVMDAGKLVELGPPEELLMRPDGWFSRLAST